MKADRRSLPLLDCPEAFTPEELARIAELCGLAPDDERLVEFVGDALDLYAGLPSRRRGCDGWVRAVARYIRRRPLRGWRPAPVDVPEPLPANVVDLAAWRERQRTTNNPEGAA